MPKTGRSRFIIQGAVDGGGSLSYDVRGDRACSPHAFTGGQGDCLPTSRARQRVSRCQRIRDDWVISAQNIRNTLEPWEGANAVSLLRIPRPEDGRLAVPVLGRRENAGGLQTCKPPARGVTIHADRQRRSATGGRVLVLSGSRGPASCRLPLNHGRVLATQGQMKRADKWQSTKSEPPTHKRMF